MIVTTVKEGVKQGIGALSANATFIPPTYKNGTTWIYGYDDYSGGTIYATRDSVTGSYWKAGSTGDWIQFKFWGTFVNVIFWSAMGKAKIYIDDLTTPYAEVDVSALGSYGRHYVWKGPNNLSDDYHTIRIEAVALNLYVCGIMVDGTKNAWRVFPFYHDLFYNLQQCGYRGIYSDSGIYVQQFPTYRTSVSTTSTLGANASWTSSSVDCLGSNPRVKKIYITCYSDVDGTIYVEFSPNNSNWDAVESISYTGGSTSPINPIEVKGRYARIRYVNGATAQSVFRLYAWFLSD